MIEMKMGLVEHLHSVYCMALNDLRVCDSQKASYKQGHCRVMVILMLNHLYCSFLGMSLYYWTSQLGTSVHIPFSSSKCDAGENSVKQVSEYNHHPELIVCLTHLPNSDYPITT